ncbi:MAG: B12-binding domain-containing radical SAM protein [Nitrospirae bacterium]|nr:B12-binding domain-containing radical SAM protein [Nitrospirota bacterium]
MKKVLLINPNYYDEIFQKSKVRAAISRGIVPMGLTCIAAPLTEAGHEVNILNLNISQTSLESLSEYVRMFNPDYAGITSTTPLIYKAYEIASVIKRFNKNIPVIAGGPHPSALPEDVLRESEIDCVVKGEGDLILKDIVENGISASIPNIYYKDNGTIVRSENQGICIKDLNALPYPAFQLLDIKNYFQPRISSRKQPLGYIETSRGCFSKCIFCNKNIHGYAVRMKDPERVVDEMERMLGMGFNEIQIIDDIFTASMKRAYQVCEAILKRGLKFPWYPRGGIRVDRVNLELLKIMKRAGCYRIPFGIESGSQRIIDLIQKNITLEQAEKAVELAKAAGLETECYFMIGHPTETVEDLKKSINFAVKLNPDYVKFAITIPLPGTQMFDEMSEKGQIKTRDWSKYNFSISPRALYDHDVLSWSTIDKYYGMSHRAFYFRPAYMLGMLYKTLQNGTLLDHAKAVLKTKWF